jgi:hypothetical protein
LIKEPFKVFMHKEWTKWTEVSNDNLWESVKCETVMKSFKNCSVSNVLDGMKVTFYEESESPDSDIINDEFGNSDVDFLEFCGH